MFNLKSSVARVVTSVVLTLVLLTGVVGVYADSLKTIQEPKEETFEQFVESANLSFKEKQALLTAEEAKTPIYDKINKINDSIREIEQKILKEASPIFEQIYSIKDSHIKLVKKMDENININQESAKTYIEYVKLSDVLSQKEKEILIKDHATVSELYKKVKAYYIKAANETSELKNELKTLQSKISKIDSDNEEIWNKLYK